jgi:branched-chain amino acid transport system substrate-binding protein
MSGVTIQGLTGGDEGLNWEPTGEVNKQPKAVIIKDGTYTAM